VGKFSKIPENTFKTLQTDAGVLLKNFDPSEPELVDENIICATTGGINPTCVATYSDMAEGIDNAPKNMKELMHLDGWDCGLGFTALSITKEVIRMALGAADISVENGSIVPRMELKDTDFSDVWWVGDMSDGGLCAVRLINALSTDGLSLQTTDNGKGQLSVTLKGHVSIDAQDVVPMEFYVQEGKAE
jgi:hypothetical protein